MRNGPTFPDVKGLNIEWWDESNWPLTHPDEFPRFYGTCDDDADTSIPGVVRVFEDQVTETDGVSVTVTALEQYNELKSNEERERLPKEASPLKIRLALLELNLLDSVNAHLNTYDAATKAKIDIIWEFADVIPTNHPVVQNIAEGLGWTEEQLDNIFIKANEISDNPFEA
jgi:hypothetical protein